MHASYQRTMDGTRVRSHLSSLDFFTQNNIVKSRWAHNEKSCQFHMQVRKLPHKLVQYLDGETNDRLLHNIFTHCAFHSNFQNTLFSLKISPFHSLAHSIIYLYVSQCQL
jgi:hypothetical protein